MSHQEGDEGERTEGKEVSWGEVLRHEMAEVSQEMHFLVMNHSGKQGGEQGHWDSCPVQLDSIRNVVAWLRSSFLIHLNFKSGIQFSYQKTRKYIWSTLDKYIHSFNSFNLRILWNLNISRILSMKTSEMRYTVSVKI